MWRSFLFAFKLTNVCVTDIMYVMPWCAGEQRAREFAMKLASMLLRRICWACTGVRVSLHVCMRMIPCNKMCVVSICLLRKTSVQTVYTHTYICCILAHDMPWHDWQHQIQHPLRFQYTLNNNSSHNVCFIYILLFVIYRQYLLLYNCWMRRMR